MSTELAKENAGRQRLSTTVGADQVIVEDLVEGTLLHDLDRYLAHHLNERAGFVCRRAECSATAADLSAALSQRLAQGASQDVLWMALELIERARVLETKIEVIRTAKVASRNAAEC